MTSQAIPQLIAREEYLALEEHSPLRHQFYQGEIFAMAGGSFNHSAIAGNLYLALGERLRGGPCRPMNSDMRIHTPSGLDTYPDLSLFCGQPELTDQQRTLLNPVLIVEVLSPSTRNYDRGDKFFHYRSIPTLRDYLLVDAASISVEHFRRSSDGEEWVLHHYQRLEERLPLPALESELPLAEIYAAIQF